MTGKNNNNNNNNNNDNNDDNENEWEDIPASQQVYEDYDDVEEIYSQEDDPNFNQQLQDQQQQCTSKSVQNRISLDND